MYQFHYEWLLMRGSLISHEVTFSSDSSWNLISDSLGDWASRLSSLQLVPARNSAACSYSVDKRDSRKDCLIPK